LANITSKTANIRTAVNGKDVREALASGIEVMNIETENTTASQLALEGKQATANSNEAIRVTNETSRVTIEGERVTEFDGIKTDYNTYKNVMIAESNVAALQNGINNNAAKGVSNASSIVENTNAINLNAIAIANVASGTPRTTYTTLALLQAGIPAGEIYSYVCTDGHRYWWNGTAWTDGGIYQGIGIADDAVKLNNIDGVTTVTGKNIFNKLGSLNDCPPVDSYSNTSYDSVNNLVVTLGLAGVALGKGQKFNVIPNTSYTVSSKAIGQDHTFSIQDESGADIETATVVTAGNIGTLTFNSGSNTHVYFVLFTHSTTGTYGLQNIQIEQGYVATDYEEYALTISTLFNSSISDAKSRNDLINLTNNGIKINNLLGGSPNIAFTKYYVANKIYDITDTLIDAQDFYFYKIPLSDYPDINQVIYMAGVDASHYFTHYFLDVDSNVIGHANYVEGDIRTTDGYPTGTTYLVIQGDESKLKHENMMIILGAVMPSNYISPGIDTNWIDNYVNKTVSNNASYNPLYGKTVLWNGDSIMYGADRSGSNFLPPQNNSGFAKMIVDDNKMIGLGYGISGGTIAAETYLNGTIPMHWISRDIVNMQAEADYIIFEGGINDFWFASPMGVITPDYATAFDDTTFCGALETTFSQSQLKWLGKKIGFIIMHKIYNTTDYVNKNLSELYFDKVRLICEKWGVPYLDLFKDSNFNTSLKIIRDTYTNHPTDENGDGCHPLNNGYREYLTPKIEAWMKTL